MLDSSSFCSAMCSERPTHLPRALVTPLFPLFRRSAVGLAALALVFALGTGVGAGARAQTAGNPTWSQLSPDQRRALAPLQRDWDQLDATRRQKWLEVASRFESMPPQRQERVRERMNEWARMSPAQRSEARANFQQSKKLSPAERQARWDAYRSLPDDERAALAAARSKPFERPGKPGPVQSLRTAPVDVVQPKSNVVAPRDSALPPPRPVAPTVVQGNPGATTKLLTDPERPPLPQKPGQPKISASPREVDRATLLPKTGPQAPPPRNGRAAPSRPGGRGQ